MGIEFRTVKLVFRMLVGTYVGITTYRNGRSVKVPQRL